MRRFYETSNKRECFHSKWREEARILTNVLTVMVHRGNTDQNMGGFGDGIGDVEALANDNFGKPLLCSQKFSEYDDYEAALERCFSWCWCRHVMPYNE